MKKRAETPLGHYICLSLYRASRAVTGLYRELLADLGLTYPQYLVMRLLWQRDTLSVGEIGHVLDLDHRTLSPLLKRLERGGLIQRRRRSEDERSVDIELTPHGRALEARSHAIPDQFTGSLGQADSEINALRRTLDHLAASAETAASR